MRLLPGDVVTVAKEWGEKPLLIDQRGTDAVARMKSGDHGIVICATAHGQLWTKVMAHGAIGWMVTNWLTKLYGASEVVQYPHGPSNSSEQG